MKVLHLISGGDKGGAKTHMFALLDELCKICDVTVICLMRGVFYEEILERDVNVILLEQKSRFDLSVVKKIAEMVNRDGYDVINAHGARANFIAQRLIKKVRVPVCTTIHSDYLLDFDSAYKKLIYQTLNTSALKKIRYKIAVSDAFRDMLISRGFMPNDVLTVYNGMDFGVKVDPLPREEFAKKYGVPYDEDTVYIGIAARFDFVKGVDVFIRAAAEILKSRENVRFVIAGEGDEKESLQALAAGLGVADRVHFVGFVSPIYDFLNFIDINALTSRSESFPYSILEGARMSKPTVAAAVGGIPHLIIDSETGMLFAADDYAGCAEKMIALIDSEKMRAVVGTALYKKASSEFSNRALAEAYKRNYADFIRKYNRKKRYDVVLSGYYGFGNFGDDVILSTILQTVRALRPECEVLIFSKNPKRTMEQTKVDAVNRYDPRAIKRAFRDSLGYVNGGGTLFTDVTSTHSLVYYVQLVKMARRAGLSTMVLANGVGPFIKKKNEKRALDALSGVNVITLRDRGAYEYLCEKIPEADPKLSTDVIFMLSEKDVFKGAAPASLPGVKLPEKYVVVSLRDHRLASDAFVSAVSQACDRICRERGLGAVFLPMQYEKDYDISVSAAAGVGAQTAVIPESVDSVNDKLRVIAGAQLTLAMRLHTVIFSTINAVPTVGLSYDVKVENFMRENDLGSCLDIEAVTPDALYAAMAGALDEAGGGKKRTALSDEMKARSQVNREALTGFIDSLK